MHQECTGLLLACPLREAIDSARRATQTPVQTFASRTRSTLNPTSIVLRSFE